MTHGQKTIKLKQPNTTNVFIALVATSFRRYDHLQSNVIQNLRRLVTLSP